MTLSPHAPNQAEEICRRYYPLIFRYVSFRVNSREDAEDIVSDVFLKVLGAKHIGRNPSRDIRPLLFTSAKHLIIDYYRTRERRSHVQPHPEMEELIDPASVVGQTVAEQDLMQGLRRLTAEQYMVVFLRFLERYSIQETAVIMKKRPGSIKALQFRALQSLRLFLNEENPHERK